MIKYVPNTLSTMRLVLVLSLFALSFPLSPFFMFYAMTPIFLVIYTIAGVTDMIDGPIARKFNVCTPLGANLDGIADYVFVAVSIILIIPRLDINYAIIAVIVIGIIVLKSIGMIVGFARFSQLMMMHTYASKAAALIAFLIPLVIPVSGLSVNVVFGIFGVYVYLFLLEEIAINVVMPEPKRDIGGIMQALRIRKGKMNN